MQVLERELPLVAPSELPLGSVRIPGSKSLAARALVLAAMAPGESRLGGLPNGEDTAHLKQALACLGVPGRQEGEAWCLQGGLLPRAEAPVEVGASGTALRFLLPWIALRAAAPVDLVGDPRLFERPLGPLLEALKSLGAEFELQTGGLRVRPATAPPMGLDLEVEATTSSQFLTGLALVAAGLPKGGRLRWKGAPASLSYLDLTRQTLARFGCASQLGTTGWQVEGGELRGSTFTIPGDWSGAAAFLCAAAVLSRVVRVGPLDPDDLQGDRALLSILAQAGSHHHWEGDALCFQGQLRQGFQAELGNCPDLAPVLAATAALAPGPSIFSGLETLPLKECDRLEASRDLVQWLGGEARVEGSSRLFIQPGVAAKARTPFNPRNDHRMAFAAAVGALRRGGRLLNPGCVGKTFPDFWSAWSILLGQEP